MKVQANVRVQVTLQILPDDSWGEECGLPQIWKQGIDSAVGFLRNALQVELRSGKISFVGEPKIVTVLVERTS